MDLVALPRDRLLPLASYVDASGTLVPSVGFSIVDATQLRASTYELRVDPATAGNYLVYMVGFMPGFAYLGGLSDRIATPRRSSPRTAVPAGSVGIGGQQTGVYPVESPGGWNLIGRTPLKIFDIARDEHTLLATGDRVRFVAISASEYGRYL